MTASTRPADSLAGPLGTTEAPPPFDLIGVRPTGFTVLEASAGTGKTYSLAGLALRFVAEVGLEASQLCIVSFTEAATAELRGRVRTKLAEAQYHLATGAPTDDDVLRVVAGCAGEERVVRLSRVEAALADFDAATISTIHGFCSRVVATGGGFDLPLTALDTDVDELVNDRMLERYGAAGEWPAEPTKLAEAVRLRLRLPDAALFTLDDNARSKLKPDAVPRADDLDEIAALVEEMVLDVRRRRALSRRRTFDGLITDARDHLRGPAGAATRAALQARFRLVMIDEFQDTDHVQWDIFRSAFLEGPRPLTMVVVGDPKQSIYRFRSAELSAYLAARDRADAITSLDTNRRSDGEVLDGLDTLFAGYEFGDPRVAFQPVKPAPGRETGVSATASTPGVPAVEIRSLAPTLATNEARACARDDLVAEVVRLLESGSASRASDIGVLVRSNADATRYVGALAAAGVPAASSSNDSVLDSPAALQWRILLSALERPSSPGRARAAAMGWFVGLAAHELDALDDDGMGELAERLRRWALSLSDGGLAQLMSQVRGGGLLERVLGQSGGERDLTDLDHVQELMQGAVASRPVGASALLAVLDDLTTPGPADEEELAPELLARRIDRDDDTVKVLTVHRAKGLEFPVVLCPTLWTARAKRQGPPHAQMGGGRLIDTNCIRREKPGKGGSVFTPVEKCDKDERAGEDSRLLYVALTRAKHRLVLWWSPAAVTKNSFPPLGDLFAHSLGADPGDELDVEALAVRSGGSIAVTSVPERPTAAVLGRNAADRPVLAVAQARRVLDRTWRIWSFSAMKAMAEANVLSSGDLDPEDGVVGGNGVAAADDGATDGPEPAVGASGAEPDAGGGVDEPSVDEVAAAHEQGRLGTDMGPGREVTLLQGAPGGTGFGRLVHTVLERVDFAADDDQVLHDLRERSAELLRHRRLPITPDALAEGLLVALRTPLGGCMGARRLVDLERSDRLDELGFDLPLAGLDAGAIAEVLARHLPDDDPLRPWFTDAANGALAVDVAGLLTGSIDLVARTADGRYWLADYKTNFLPDGEYGPDAMATAMGHHGYPLQATLYLVALHRFLRWRLRGYDPDRHLDGAAYLFLRGMGAPAVGAEAPEAPGIVWWRPPTVAILELDRLLATGRAGP